MTHRRPIKCKLQGHCNANTVFELGRERRALEYRVAGLCSSENLNRPKSPKSLQHSHIFMTCPSQNAHQKNALSLTHVKCDKNNFFCKALFFQTVNGVSLRAVRCLTFQKRFDCSKKLDLNRNLECTQFNIPYRPSFHWFYRHTTFMKKTTS